MTPEEFYQALENHHIFLSLEQKEQFEQYFSLLVEWNQKINLTAITNKADVYLKHFYDSIAPILLGKIDNIPLKLLDIGAGAGFPSIPIKIIYPNIDVTIIDSLQKRIHFLETLSETLHLEHIHFFHGRAEDFGCDKQFRAQFDIVSARAVARLQVLLELSIPFLKLNGRLLALKASASQKEIQEAQSALSTLFCQVKSNESYQLPNGDQRALTIIIKKKETPKKYPRRAGIPNKKPL